MTRIVQLSKCGNVLGPIVILYANSYLSSGITSATDFFIELLYGRDPLNPRKPKLTIHPTDKAANFRWIHLPANNMAWVEALLTKAFIEEGASDVEGFKALEKSFSHQHRGQQMHSHFMRPLCQSTPRAPRIVEEPPPDFKPDPGPPTIIINGGSDANGGPKTPSKSSTWREDSNDA